MKYANNKWDEPYELMRYPFDEKELIDVSGKTILFINTKKKFFSAYKLEF